MVEAKTQCEKCGREILQATADRTNGLCMPCKKGWVAHLPIEEASEPDQSSIPPPVYDIDDFHPNLCRNEDKMHPIHFAYRLWTIIESDDDKNHRRDSHLLEPEIVLRDVCQFDSTMGNGFATQLGYCGGVMTFARGLRAVATLGATEHLKIMQKAKDSVLAEGLEFPTDTGDPYDYDDGIDYDLEKAIDARNGRDGSGIAYRGSADSLNRWGTKCPWPTHASCAPSTRQVDGGSRCLRINHLLRKLSGNIRINRLN